MNQRPSWPEWVYLHPFENPTPPNPGFFDSAGLAKPELSVADRKIVEPLVIQPNNNDFRPVDDGLPDAFFPKLLAQVTI